MVLFIILICVTQLIWGAIVIYMFIKHEEERQKLLDRIMSVDYSKFKQWEEKRTTELLDPESPLSDEDEFVMERGREETEENKENRT